MPNNAIVLAGMAAALCISCTGGGRGGATAGRGGDAQKGGADGSAGSSSGTGGNARTGGSGGTTATGGQSGDGGASTTGGAGGSAGTSGGQAGGGSGGTTSNVQGPCDIYRDAGQPCVAAYSTVRRVLSTYAGPLYQIRSGSSDQNTGSGGQTHDIGQTADGFADAAAVDTACAGTICTVSLLYDQSGRGSHLPVAKAGTQFGGPYAAMDDFESSATKEALMVGGHRVYSLYMEPRQGYRLPRRGDGVPRGSEPQGIYLLADGTHAGDGCCWDFGNGGHSPFLFADSNALVYGSGGMASGVPTGGAGDGPWFMWDTNELIIAGGSTGADPLLTSNPNNPSLKTKFALGFLKTAPRVPATLGGTWALRMADVTAATAVTTAHQGDMPKGLALDGAVMLGIDAHNSNNSWGTFYEGAIVAGFPADDTELSVLQNIKAVGYGK